HRLSIFTSIHTFSPSLPPSTPSLHLYFHPHLPSIFTSIHTFSPRCLLFTRDITSCAEFPEVFLLQKTPSSPVTCMATGFYPDSADLFWRKDGEQIFEDVEHGELLPNHDGTFQMSVELKVEVTAEVEGKYECVFQLSGVKEDLVTKLERRSILSNASHEGEKDTFSWRCFPSQVHLSPLLIHVTMTTLDVCMQTRHGGVELSEKVAAEG
ncbi:major histocompatibility complex class I-related gene protein-like, partial [Nerophis lumbriciformis]|uniref:major histocompatibility complex class I-related gene protein-like n=1 Tax=Nerophis lumbriciformis TaxID=546530 RepID=UPI003BAA5F47